MNMYDISNIAGFETFLKIELVDKGWSKDKKYYIETVDNRRLLLRISNISEYERKRIEFGMMQQLMELAIPMSQPIEFGICDRGNSVYVLLTWCDGEDAETRLPALTEIEQYNLGIKAGEILKKLHSIPASKAQEDWAIRFNKKINTKIKKYHDCGISFEGDTNIMAYIEQNREFLENRPQCYQHGDYHVGNMIISSDGVLSIIDFNRPDFGDPWEEFNRIVWSATVSPHFSTGQLIGYFGGKPPIEFFRLLALYISSNALSSIYWALPFGKEEIAIMKKQAQDILAWFDNMQNVIPSWYIEDI